MAGTGCSRGGRRPGAGCAPAATGRSNTGALAGQPVIRPSLAMLAEPSASIDLVQPVIHPEMQRFMRRQPTGLELLPPVFGGATRQASVRAGLEALAAASAGDRAGPRRRPAVRLAGADRRAPSRRPAQRRRRPGAAGRRHGEDRRRQRHRHRHARSRRRCASCRRRRPSTSTPLLDAHRRAQAAGREDFTDDAALAEWAGLEVATFEGETSNVKLTTAGGFRARGGRAARRARRRAHRLRLRRASVRRRRSRLARRRAHRP